MDEHVPSTVTEGVRQRGVDVLTVQQDGRVGVADAELLDHATESGRVLFTRDTDFLKEAASRQQHGDVFAGVIYAHQLRVSIGECVENLELLAKTCEPEDFKNQLMYLPLR
jgi:predicted nuclease of predicted toxin-antitoxin system